MWQDSESGGRPSVPGAPVVPGYRVQERIGVGGCGEVWRAQDVLSGRLVALKRLRHDGPPAERDRLRREAAVLAGLSSPHLVRLVTVVTAADGLVLVLDYVGGGSLASLLRTRPALDHGEVVTIAAPLAQALAAVHAVGLVHGDVSPANVLFTTDGRPVLSDLGVARLVGSSTDAVTEAYADPAVIAGAPLTKAGDVYSLAAVCFAALAGRPLGEEERAAAGAPLRQLAAAAPEALVAAVESGLCLDAARRPDAAAFAARLLQACPARPVRLAGATVPVTSPPTTNVRRLPEPSPPEEPVPSRGERLSVAIAKVRVTPRRLVALAAVPVALGAAIWGGVAWARSTTSTQTWATPVPSGSAPVGSVPLPKAAGVPVTATASAVIVIPTNGSSETGGTPHGDPSDNQRIATSVPSPVVVPTALPAVKAATPTSPSPRSTAVLTAAQLRLVLVDLDRVRDHAFRTGDLAALPKVYAAGSAPLAQDRQRLQALVTAGDHARGLQLVVTRVTVRSGTARNASLSVTDELGAYSVVTAQDSLVQRLPARAEVTWDIELVRLGDGWRISAISAA